MCLCVLSKRDGQEIMPFFTICVSVCLCVQSKRDGKEILTRPVLRFFFYVCPRVCVSSLKEMVKRLRPDHF